MTRARRRRRWRWGRRAVGALAIIGALVVPTGPAAAQTEVPLEVQDADVGRGHRVAFTVTAPRELIGQALGAEHFRVTEGGQPRQAKVEQLPSDRLEVVLVLDTSGSMQGEPMAAAKDAAVDFVSRMPAGTRIAVVGFGTEPTVARALSTDTGALVQAIDGLEAAGETALYDAVTIVASQLGSAADGSARRAVVLLSDGGDTASAATIDDAVASLASIDASFYAVALATSESDLGALATLAQVTEGRVAAASAPEEIAGVYDDIASTLVNQYRVSYRSEVEGPVTVDVTLEAGAVVARASQTVELPPIAETSATPVTQPVAEPYVVGAPGLFAREWTLVAGVVPVGLALAIAIWMLRSQREPKQRKLARELGVAIQAEASSMVSGMSGKATAFAERMLAKNEGQTSRLNAKLERAGLLWRPDEFVVLATSVVVGGAAVVLFVAGPALALVAGAVLAVGVWQGLTFMEHRRQNALADQLGDTLQLLAGSLRAGHGLVQALDQVTREAESPTAEEFHRVIVESRLGRDLADALDAMAVRAGNEDIEWVVQAIRIHREVGGDLAEILDRVGETIRERNRVRGQVRALTAEGRLSGIVLMALPFLVGGWMYYTNRPYIMELFTRPAGRLILAVGALLMACGAAVMKRLVRPEF